MKISLVYLVASFAVWFAVDRYMTNNKPCTEFTKGQVVIVDRDDEVMATITSSQRVQGECLYKVNGQKGTEMPFTDYVAADNLTIYRE